MFAETCGTAFAGRATRSSYPRYHLPSPPKYIQI